MTVVKWGWVWGFTLCFILNELAFAADPGTVKLEPATIKLEPQIRSEASHHRRKTLGVIPIARIRPFIKKSLIFDCKEQFATAPVIIGEEGSRLEGGRDAVLYARGIQCSGEKTYTVYRGGRTYTHPVTGEMLGFEALAVGTAEVKELGDPTSLKLISSEEAIEIGTRILPSFTSALPASLTIRPARICKEGFILSARDSFSNIGRNQVVIISLGLRDGLEEGNILDIYRKNRTALDPNGRSGRGCQIKLPDSRVGSLLVYQTYEKLSLALIVEATELISLLDKVRTP